MRMVAARRVLVLLGMVVCLAAVAACGSSSSSSSAASPSSSASATPASASGSGGKSPIVVGLVTDETGAVASNGIAFKPGFVAWADDTNAHGGILGHPVKIVAMDSKSDPTALLAAVNQLKAQKVTVFVPGQAQGVKPIDKEIDASFPAVGPFQGDDFTNPYEFPVTTTVDRQAAALSYAAVRAGKKHGALFYCVEIPICAQALVGVRQSAQAYGASMIGIGVSGTSPDYTAQCLRAQSAGVDYAIFGAAASTMGRVVADCAKNNYKPQWVSGVPDKSYYTNPAIEGTLLTLPEPPPNAPALSGFRAAMQKYQSQFLSNPSYGQLTVLGWLSGEMITAAVQAAKPTGANVTTADILKGLWTFKNQTFGGQSVPLTFVQGKPTSVNCFFAGKISGGKLVQTQTTPVCPPK